MIGFTPWRILATLALLLPFAVSADPVSDYFTGMETFEASFTQHVVDVDGEVLQDSSGEVWISKPGRFRWDYRKPYQQLIVSDGKQLWNYDADLEQASVSPVNDTLTSTPAMLLSGLRPLAEVTKVHALAKEDGLDWFQLEPKDPDAAVEAVRIAFRDGELDSIEVRDSFDNRTRIQFSHIKLNPSLDPALFHLELPPGTDIIGKQP